MRQKGGGRISEIQAQVGKEDRLVAFDGEQAEAVLGTDHLHKVSMGMQRISGIHARSARQTGQDFFGNGNLVGFLTNTHLQQGFLALMSTKGQQVRSWLLGGACTPDRFAIQSHGFLVQAGATAQYPGGQHHLNSLRV